jgi:hypothetical protein
MIPGSHQSPVHSFKSSLQRSSNATSPRSSVMIRIQNPMPRSIVKSARGLRPARRRTWGMNSKIMMGPRRMHQFAR